MTQELPIKITRRAAGQIQQAAEWWEQNRSLTPGAVHDELSAAFALLRAQPRIGAIATNNRLQGVRRLHLSRIHYFLYYRILPERIDVLALWHTSRGTGSSLKGT